MSAGSAPFQTPASWRLRWVLGSRLVSRGKILSGDTEGPFSAWRKAPLCSLFWALCLSKWSWDILWSL